MACCVTIKFIGLASEMIYHIAQRSVWDSAQSSGWYRADSLQHEGFIHGSLQTQILAVANTFYRGQCGLVLLCIDTAHVKPPMRYELPAHPSGASPQQGFAETGLFPHIYGALNVDAVVRVVDFPPGDDGVFTLPELL